MWKMPTSAFDPEPSLVGLLLSGSLAAVADMRSRREEDQQRSKTVDSGSSRKTVFLANPLQTQEKVSDRMRRSAPILCPPICSVR
jgi:hypothetical protein